MTIRLSKLLGERGINDSEVRPWINAVLFPWLREVSQKFNQHVVVVPVTAPGIQLDAAPSRIVLVEIDTAALSWAAGNIALPETHYVGDEFIFVDTGGLAGAANATVTSTSTITGGAVLSTNFGSLRFMSNGTSWRRV